LFVVAATTATTTVIRAIRATLITRKGGKLGIDPFAVNLRF